MVTLEISSTEIRIMEFEGNRILKWANLYLEPGIFIDEVATDFQSLGNAVKQLMASSGIKDRNITVSVNSLYSLSRIITIPTPIELDVSEKAVMEAAEDLMPLAMDEMYVSWRSLGPGEGGHQVLLVGVPRDVIDSEMRALRYVGISPHILDLKTIALTRAINKESALIININKTSFDIVIVENNLPELLRTLAWQPDDFSIEEMVEHLFTTVGITLDFYNSQKPGTVLGPSTPLFFTGQMAANSSLVETLAGMLGFPLETIALSMEYPPHLPVSQYAVNIGLALISTSSGRFNFNFPFKRKPATQIVVSNERQMPHINLLPDSYKPWRPALRQVYYTLAVIASIALLLPVYRLTNDAIRITENLDVKLAAITTQIEFRKAEIAKREPLERFIDGYNSIVNLGGGFIEDLDVIRGQADELGVEVTSIVHNGGTITFSAEAETFTAFRNYISALENNGRFLSPVTPPEQYPNVKGGPISITTKPRE